jgi:hypothetical protein
MCLTCKHVSYHYIAMIVLLTYYMVFFRDNFEGGVSFRRRRQLLRPVFKTVRN